MFVEMAAYSPEEIYYSSSPSPSTLLYESRSSSFPFLQMQRRDAQSITSPRYHDHHDDVSYDPARGRALQHVESVEDMKRKAYFLQRREWLRRVAAWITQTGAVKAHHLDAIPEIMEEALASPEQSEQVLYVASPPSTATPWLGPIHPPTLSMSSSSSSSSSRSPPPAKNAKRTNHRRTSSLKSISEETEE